jgi:hypothetical protein
MRPTGDLVRRLEAAGADVSSSGPGLIIIVIDCEAMPRVAVLDEVLAATRRVVARTEARRPNDFQ